MANAKKAIGYEDYKDDNRCKSLSGMASKILRQAGFKNTMVNSRHRIRKK